MTDIVFSEDYHADIGRFAAGYPEGKVFLATESTVNSLWIEGDVCFRKFPRIVIPAGEENKQISSVEMIWKFLSRSGADRKSLLINAGGGMLTDLAGFAASTFKRGISFINVPTTLLSQVDASVGGKTGFNFDGLKNEIGTFCEPRGVVIHICFLRTLDVANFWSGYAEMVKHGLIFSPDHLKELMEYDTGPKDEIRLSELIRHSVEIKKHFVLQDPLEKNIRKALNFGHTIGHAIESLALEQKRPLLHGYAVAWGMVAELYLSARLCGFPAPEMNNICQWIKKSYGSFDLSQEDSGYLWNLMQHDKKSEGNRLNFTLLSGTGQFEINRNCEKEQIMESLHFLRNL